MNCIRSASEAYAGFGREIRNVRTHVMTALIDLVMSGVFCFFAARDLVFLFVFVYWLQASPNARQKHAT